MLIEILLQYSDAIYPAPAYSTVSVSTSRVKEILRIEPELKKQQMKERKGESSMQVRVQLCIETCNNCDIHNKGR